VQAAQIQAPVDGTPATAVSEVNRQIVAVLPTTLVGRLSLLRHTNEMLNICLETKKVAKCSFH
jgi:hypothetical protein